MKTLDKLTGKTYKSSDILFADKIIELKNTKSKWDVIDLLIKQWQQEHPRKYDSFVVSVDAKRDTRATKYGSNKQKTIRETIDFPQPIHDRIRAVYKADEVPFDKKFFEAFWKRYEVFRVAEKL